MAKIPSKPRILTTTVNDIEHTESTSMYGMGIIKIFFQPNVDIRTATSQVSAVSQPSIRQMPAGTTPPLVLNYNASTVPVLQLASSSRVLSEQQVLDLLSQGLIYKEIGEKLGISYETVHTYIRRIYEKLQVRTRTEAVAKFLRR